MDTILSEFLTQYFGSYKEVTRIPEALNLFVYRIVDESGRVYYVKRRGYTRFWRSSDKIKS